LMIVACSDPFLKPVMTTDAGVPATHGIAPAKARTVITLRNFMENLS
jgi:hypothetical protein